MSAVASTAPGLLTGLVCAPLMAALLLTLAGALGQRVRGSDGDPSGLWRASGQAFTAALFVVGGVGLWTGFDPEALGFQYVERLELLPQYGFHMHFAIDGLSLFPVLLVLFIVPLAGWMTRSRMGHATPGAVARVLVLQSFVLGALLSVNLMQIFVFWTWLLLPTFFLIVSWGGPSPLRAALSWFMPAAIGSALMLFVLIVVHRLAYEQLGIWVFDLVGPGGRIAYGLFDVAIAPSGSWWASQVGLFTIFLVAIAVRLRAFPFHVWSTAASEDAPTDGLVLLDGLQLIVGVYLLVRVGLPLFPEGAERVAPYASGVAVFGLIYGALVAAAQRDLRRLQGFAQTAALGLTGLGLFTLGEHGIVGGLLQAWSICLAGSALLVLVGMLVERRGSTSLDDYGGLAKPMPVFSVLLATALFSLSGVPGSVGFVGELLVLAGGFARDPALTLAALAGVLFVGACLIHGFRAVALGPVKNPENRGLIDLSWRERLTVLALLIPLVAFGIHPNPVLRRVEPAVLEVLHTMELRRDRAADAQDDGRSSSSSSSSTSSSAASNASAEPRGSARPMVVSRSVEAG